MLIETARLLRIYGSDESDPESGDVSNESDDENLSIEIDSSPFIPEDPNTASAIKRYWEAAKLLSTSVCLPVIPLFKENEADNRFLDFLGLGQGSAVCPRSCPYACSSTRRTEPDLRPVGRFEPCDQEYDFRPIMLEGIVRATRCKPALRLCPLSDKACTSYDRPPCNFWFGCLLYFVVPPDTIVDYLQLCGRYDLVIVGLQVLLAFDESYPTDGTA